MTAIPKPTPQIIPANTISTSTALRWHSVVTRDQNARFVYGVLTTKIYCRPSCPARLARRANVDFYDTPSQAERAGFRACKRCKPETLKPAVNPQIVVVQRAVQTIRSDVKEGRKTTLSRLAAEARLTPSHFHRVFKKVTGVTPGVYVAGIWSEGTRTGGADTQGCETEVGEKIEKVSMQGGSSSLNLEHDNSNMDQFLYQPCGEHTGLDLSACLTGDANWDAGLEHEPVDADLQGTLLWNDFDVLIAAEAEIESRQDSALLSLAGVLG